MSARLEGQGRDSRSRARAGHERRTLVLTASICNCRLQGGTVQAHPKAWNGLKSCHVTLPSRNPNHSKPGGRCKSVSQSVSHVLHP
jgi:hypothetical protein